MSYRLFILGAGFSKACGLPLGSELWKKILDHSSLLTGRAGKFHEDLEKYLKFQIKCKGLNISKENVNFEDFLGFLDIEHFLGLRGSDTWSPDGNETTVVVKTLIGKILCELTPTHENIPKLYLKFAKSLRPGDLVLTFNYDILLERALETVGKKYRLFTKRYESVYRDGGGIVETSDEDVVVLKLHGSIDWFDRTTYSWLEANRKRDGYDGQTPNPVFAHGEELGVSQLVEGPRPTDDPLSQMYRVKNIDVLYKQNIMFQSTPWLLAPSVSKILYTNKIKSFFYGMGDKGVFNSQLSIIGYSLPHQDEYALQVLYDVITNYQEYYWDKRFLRRKKRPMVIVDKCRNSKDIRNLKHRFSFVNWERTTLCVNGWDQEAARLSLGAGPKEHKRALMKLKQIK